MPACRLSIGRRPGPLSLGLDKRLVRGVLGVAAVTGALGMAAGRAVPRGEEMAWEGVVGAGRVWRWPG